MGGHGTRDSEAGFRVYTWGLIKIMGPFGVGIIVYSLQFKGPKGARNFDQPPLTFG